MSIDRFHEEIADTMLRFGFEEYPFCASYTKRENGRFEAAINIPNFHPTLPDLPEHIGIKAITPESALTGLIGRLSDLRRRMREFMQAKIPTNQNANGEE